MRQPFPPRQPPTITLRLTQSGWVAESVGPIRTDFGPHVPESAVLTAFRTKHPGVLVRVEPPFSTPR